MSDVKVWIENIVIPTYPVGTPEKNPIFLEKRVYQGSSGVVYPHPVIEKIYDHKEDKTYKAVYLENQYLKIMVLPELGGRVQMAYDKLRERHFVYYNQVIKPALVGLTGPWISGGIEFNWPQHHRPSTFDPVDFTVEENKDGSKTIWVNEVELMFRTKGMAGFTLHPDKAFLEIKVKLFNRTPFPQTFLWWANPAVKVNDYYQSVFPPDVHAVFDHGKRDVSDFPIATGTYYKVNYAPGTDISMYKNIPVPTSYMAVQSSYDFIGCYEHDTKAGMLHVANHHVSTGKKQWTWGNGDFGQAWDKNLTDEDGPYIELMCGAFTDNQPDFSWLQPNEEKTFEQYFMPYAEIGMVKNATIHAAVNIAFNAGSLHVGVYATAVYNDAEILVFKNDDKIVGKVVNLSPQHPFSGEFLIDGTYDEYEIKVLVQDVNGKCLVQYQPEVSIEKQVPDAAKPALKPADIKTNEQLFLNGLHLEQYRHATFNAADYYLEALKRDETDIRCNNAMGLLMLRCGRFDVSEKYLRAAVKSLTTRNPNPYEGSALYNLGICLKHQGKLSEAYSILYKSTWNDECQHSAFLELARIAAARGDFDDAIYLVNKSLAKNYYSNTARHLKAILLRKNKLTDEAVALVNESLTLDKFNYGCLLENYFTATEASLKKQALAAFTSITRSNFNTLLEYALDYASAGFYREAIDVLHLYTGNNKSVSPLAHYYLGWLCFKSGENALVADHLAQGSAAIPNYCFPSKLEDKMALEFAVTVNANDSKAHYYLGNYWYAKRQYDKAINHWEKSQQIDNSFPTVLRNLSLAYYNKLKRTAESVALLERAFSLDTSDARILMELDQLYKIENISAKRRLALLEQHAELVELRDDLYLEKCTLYNQLGEYDICKSLMAQRKFHPWEGGEGKVVLQFLICHIELAKKAIMQGKTEYALQLLESISTYPDNLGEGKLYGTQENDIHYLQGCAYESLGLTDKAIEKFKLTTQGISEPVQAIFYNDPQPDKIFYQGLAWKKLSNSTLANNIFHGLVKFGNDHLNDAIEIDYFAVSLPDLLVFDQDLKAKNIIHCHYMIALGLLGLGRIEDARMRFDEVLKRNGNHQGAIVHFSMIDFLEQQNVIA